MNNAIIELTMMLSEKNAKALQKELRQFVNLTSDICVCKVTR